MSGIDDYIAPFSINAERRKTPGTYVPVTQEDVDRLRAENPDLSIMQLRWRLIGMKKEAA